MQKTVHTAQVAQGLVPEGGECGGSSSDTDDDASGGEEDCNSFFCKMSETLRSSTEHNSRKSVEKHQLKPSSEEVQKATEERGQARAAAADKINAPSEAAKQQAAQELALGQRR